MSNRPRGFGMTAELEKKTASKFDADIANGALAWVKDVLATGDDDDVKLAGEIVEVKKMDDVASLLKNGVILCHLINIIKPKSIKKVNTNKMAFKQMENIGNFLTAACDGVGCKPSDLFQTVDLYEANNIPQVINGVFALGRKAQGPDYLHLPTLGNEESKENKREFTEEQLRAGEAIIGLQAGSNKGASQAGQNFGKTRAIID